MKGCVWLVLLPCEESSWFELRNDVSDKGLERPTSFPQQNSCQEPEALVTQAQQAMHHYVLGTILLVFSGNCAGFRAYLALANWTNDSFIFPFGRCPHNRRILVSKLLGVVQSKGWLGNSCSMFSAGRLFALPIHFGTFGHLLLLQTLWASLSTDYCRLKEFRWTVVSKGLDHSFVGGSTAWEIRFWNSVWNLFGTHDSGEKMNHLM